MFIGFADEFTHTGGADRWKATVQMAGTDADRRIDVPRWTARLFYRRDDAKNICPDEDLVGGHR